MDAARELHPVNPPRVIGLLVGVDYGAKRIGLAITDPQQRLATPADVIPGSRNQQTDALAVAAWGRERRADGFIVGLPLNMDSSAGPQADIARRFAEALADASGLAVRLVDERLTSFQADQWLAESGRPKGKTRRGPARDALAALAILQTYLSQWTPGEAAAGQAGQPEPERPHERHPA